MSETPTQCDLTRERLTQLMDQAEKAAWEAVSKFRFAEGAHWMEVWSSLHKVSGQRRKNPFNDVAALGRDKVRRSRG